MNEKNCKVKQGENVKRFSWKTEKLQHSDDEVLMVVDNENKDWKGHILNIVDLLNEQQDQISYWKHKVNSLLWILGQFDKAKVKELLKELNNECELDDE